MGARPARAAPSRVAAWRARPGDLRVTREALRTKVAATRAAWVGRWRRAERTSKVATPERLATAAWRPGEWAVAQATRWAAPVRAVQAWEAPACLPAARLVRAWPARALLVLPVRREPAAAFPRCRRPNAVTASTTTAWAASTKG